MLAGLGLLPITAPATPANFQMFIHAIAPNNLDSLGISQFVGHAH